MKTVFLHGLGQTARDWQAVISRTTLPDADCPELFSLSKGNISYSGILAGLEKRYRNEKESFRICGLSLGALLALDYAIRHGSQISSLVLIGVQYKVPTLLIDFQNLLFRCMPKKSFADMGMAKQDVISLSRSMRSLDFSRGLHKIKCPVTLLCGEKDHANLKASRQLEKLLPQAKLHIIPGAGHELNQCAPDAIATVLAEE